MSSPQFSQNDVSPVNRALPFRRTPVAAFIAGLALFTSAAVHAQNSPGNNPSVIELQAEIARLKDIIAKQALSAASKASTSQQTTTDTVLLNNAGNDAVK
ncbi:MAG: hypothetical protein K2P84_05990, partial [Undibacterium sp.]|nr:hypothetical protein [Undibacterium sp.]